jgi:predicted helicase
MECVKLLVSATGLHYTDSDTSIGGCDFSPLHVLDYVYGVLYSPNYRAKYAEQLKVEFPKIPIPDDAATFWKFVHAGDKLIRLHLMKDQSRDKSALVDYPFVGKGNMVVEKSASSSYKDNRIYINKTQYFDGVPSEVWNFYIGGYQPLQKWIKSKKKSILSAEDIAHYSHMIYVIKSTQNIMKEIDEIKVF